MLAIDLDYTKRQNYTSFMGLPLPWQDEQSGVIKAAIRAFLEHQVEGTSLSEEHLKLTIQYLRYYIHAPCWYEEWPCEPGIDDPESIRKVRRQALEMGTVADIEQFIQDCLEIGIDPL